MRQEAKKGDNQGNTDAVGGTHEEVDKSTGGDTGVFSPEPTPSTGALDMRQRRRPIAPPGRSGPWIEWITGARGPMPPV